MATDPIPPAPSRGAGQRVRVGLTGLAFVFLLVMLATALLRQAGADPVDNNAAANAQAPSEPLAELGVAPGNAPPVVVPPPVAAIPITPPPVAPPPATAPSATAPAATAPSAAPPSTTSAKAAPPQ